MNITLSWDLFIIVFFALVITYSFIIGKREAVKIIVATYIAVIAVQGIGNLLGRALGETGKPILQSIGLSTEISMLSGVKLLIFIAIIVFLAIKSGLEVKYATEGSQVQSSVVTGLFGFATAGLLLSTILTYIAGVPLLDPLLAQTASLSPLVSQSQLMQAMILYQEVWFSLPAFLLIGVGFLNNK